MAVVVTVNTSGGLQWITIVVVAVRLALNYPAGTPEGLCSPPQQRDSNLGWVGGHQWGQSWRDRTTARLPARRVQKITENWIYG